jgi:hypothetical protein
MGDLYTATIAAAYRDVRRELREVGINDGREVRRMLRNSGINVAAPWCAAWVQDITDTAALSLGVVNPLDDVKHEALVQSYADWAKANDKIVKFPCDAKRGDLSLFNFGGERWDHIGIVVIPPKDNVAGTPFSTIEGNTNNAGSREGVMVAAKIRKIDPARVMFVRWA